MDKCNILIVEDHALTRFALITSLKEADFIVDVYEASEAVGAFKILAQNKVDLILMDLGLPGMDGVKATAEIRKTDKEVKIIVLTSHDGEEEVKKCVKSGISAFCSKDIKPDKLIELIKDVLKGSIWFDSSVSKYVLEMANSKDENIHGHTNNYSLTSKEKKVLTLLADGNSNLDIAKKLDISVNTTKVHVCSILQKLSVDDRTQAAVKAIKENLTEL